MAKTGEIIVLLCLSGLKCAVSVQTRPRGVSDFLADCAVSAVSLGRNLPLWPRLLRKMRTIGDLEAEKYFQGCLDVFDWWNSFKSPAQVGIVDLAKLDLHRLDPGICWFGKFLFIGLMPILVVYLIMMKAGPTIRTLKRTCLSSVGNETVITFMTVQMLVFWADYFISTFDYFGSSLFWRLFTIRTKELNCWSSDEALRNGNVLGSAGTWIQELVIDWWVTPELVIGWWVTPSSLVCFCYCVCCCYSGVVSLAIITDYNGCSFDNG